MELCFVYARSAAAMYTLNASAWLVLDLCDGRAFARIAADFADSVEPLLSPAEAEDQVAVALGSLLELGLVERCAAAPRARRTKLKRGTDA